tara:strand:- start:449 stop:571 length:123 start_codon:yes stop_codon:yes gene_type:complete
MKEANKIIPNLAINIHSGAYNVWPTETVIMQYLAENSAGE